MKALKFDLLKTKLLIFENFQIISLDMNFSVTFLPYFNGPPLYVEKVFVRGPKGSDKFLTEI